MASMNRGLTPSSQALMQSPVSMQVEAQRRELALHPRVRELAEVDEADVLAPTLALRLRDAANAQRHAAGEAPVQMK